MKKSIIGSLIGIAIVVAVDTLVRVAISVGTEGPVNLFQYEIYPGFLIGFSVCILTLITSFLGAAFTITYSDNKKKTAAIAFIIWLMLVRYGQIHLVMDTELFLPILALVLSLLGAGLAWKFFLNKNLKKTTEQPPEPPTASTHHKADTTPW